MSAVIQFGVSDLVVDGSIKVSGRFPTASLVLSESFNINEDREEREKCFLSEQRNAGNYKLTNQTKIKSTLHVGASSL